MYTYPFACIIRKMWQDPSLRTEPLIWVREDNLDLAHCLYNFGSSAGKESACNAGDLGSIPGLGRSPREGKGYPLQHSGLKNTIDCIVHGVAKSQTWLSDWSDLIPSRPLSRGLPWWLRRWSVCLQCGRPGFNPWFGKILWRRKWQSTPVLLPGKSHGQRSLVGYSP